MLAVDITRFVIFVLCAFSFVLMGFGFYFHSSCWNSKTRDYWYGRMMWNVVGMSAMLEGWIRHTPFRYSLIFIFVATIITLKGNLSKGAWGTNSEEECTPLSRHTG